MKIDKGMRNQTVINFKDEMILFGVQALFLIVFTFILKDIIAALIVSFFSRPLTNMAITWFKKNLDKRR